MPRTAFTKEQMEWIRDNSAGRTNKELVALYNERYGENKTIHSITSLKSRLGIYNKFVYTDEMVAYLREIAEGRTDKEITKNVQREIQYDPKGLHNPKHKEEI